MVSLKSDLEIDLPLKDIKIPEENNDDIQNFYKELEFTFLQSIEKSKSLQNTKLLRFRRFKDVENLVDFQFFL